MAKIYINGKESKTIESFNISFEKGGFIDEVFIVDREIEHLQAENEKLKKELDETKKELEEAKNSNSHEVGQVHLGLVVEGLEKAAEQIRDELLVANIDREEIAKIVIKVAKKGERANGKQI